MIRERYLSDHTQPESMLFPGVRIEQQPPVVETETP
jgi:hypothetical protein